MIIEVDVGSPVPPYEQVREQITVMINSGVLAPETKLPTIRQLAKDLGLAPGTVARAYRELETSEQIITRGRHGTFVATPRSLNRAQKAARLNEEAHRFAMAVDQLGIDPADALSALSRALEQR